VRGATRHDRALVWFRRDLRDFDHAALSAALGNAREVHCAFVFDREILDALPDRTDRRVEFIHRSVLELDDALRKRGGALIVRHDWARQAIPDLAARLRVDAVYANRDYEPATRARDAAVASALAERGIAFHASKDHVIFEGSEVVTRSGAPFAVFSPYRKAWLAALTPGQLAPRRTDIGDGALAATPLPLEQPIPSLEQIGFRSSDLDALRIAPGMRGARARFADFRQRIDRYHESRDYPGVKGPSYLSVHLRFGTASVRELAWFAFQRSQQPDGQGAATWLSELIWRDFFAQVLWHHPRVVDEPFRTEYRQLRFPDAPERFARWCAGMTGYPLVDAAMRQLNCTGYMHNRLRMLAASFLVKDLLCDWRLGERYFAAKLIDYDLASNNGGWQWAASVGCDAQPWFRIFNPVTQSQRFDPDGRFIRRHVPELAALSGDAIHAPWTLASVAQQSRGVVIGRDYPPPIVDHAHARKVALEWFQQARRAD